jgi:hypothetical protein
MSFFNVTLSAAKHFKPISVYAGEDISTFCPSTVTLIAQIFGNPAGSTFRWEQVLSYQYIALDYGLSQFVFAGNITSTFYSTREKIQLVSGEVIISVMDVISATYNGTNTTVRVTPDLFH